MVGRRGAFDDDSFKEKEREKELRLVKRNELSEDMPARLIRMIFHV
jgi:hypothetical protein